MPNVCGTCQRCCEGWLHAKVKNKVLSPNNPCIFLNDGILKFGCSIHEERPIKPCRIFNCLWITKNMPEKFKPSISGVIPMQNIIEKQPYIFLVNAPRYPSKELVDWFIYNYENSNILYFNKKDEIVTFGSTDFIEVVMNNKEDIYKHFNALKDNYIKD